MTWRVSPARRLVCEQYPSTQGQRYFVFGSTRVFLSSQSVVPRFSFSARIRSRRAGAGSARAPPRREARPAAAAPLSTSRRAGGGGGVGCFVLRTHLFFL